MNNPQALSLKGRMKFLLRDTVVYGGANAVTKILGLLTFPLMARYFSIEEFGLIDAFNVLAALLVTILIFGQDSAVARYFYEYDTLEEKKNVVTQSFILQLIIIAICIPLFLAYSSSISKYYGSEVDSDVIKLIIWQIPFSLLLNFAGNILKWNFKRSQYLIIQLGSSVFYVCSIFCGIYFFKIGLKETFQLFLLSRVLFGVLGLLFVAKWLTRSVRFNNMMELLKYGAPYGIICIIGAFLPALDRHFIDQYLTPYHLGIYAAATKIAFLIHFPINAFQTAWGPFYLSLFKEKDANDTYKQVFNLFTILVSVTGLVIILFAKPFIVFLAGEKYVEAHFIIAPLILGLIVMSMGWILSVGIDLTKKSYLKLYSNFLRLAITWLSIFFLISPLKLQGVAIGFLVGHIASTVLEAYYSYKLFKIDFHFFNPSLVFSIVLIIGFIFPYINIANVFLSISISILMLLSFVIFIWIVPLKRKNILHLVKRG